MPESSQPEPRAAGVGGWLLLLCRLLIIFQPLSLAVTAAGALGAMAVRGGDASEFGEGLRGQLRCPGGQFGVVVGGPVQIGRVDVQQAHADYPSSSSGS